jgi:leader peptidase (prepilin peptidase)/N-methyltransferase
MLYHAVGLAVCWALGLIRMDNHRLPTRLILFAFAVTLVPMLVYPVLMVVPWQMEVAADWRPAGRYLDALVRVIAALAAATILARYLARGLCPMADPKLDPLGQSTKRLIDLIAILAVPTIVVGWQASLAVTVLASLIAVGLRWLLPADTDSLGRFAIAVPLALTIQLVFWRQLHALGQMFDSSQRGWFWPSDGSSPWVILAWVGLVLLVPLWLRDHSEVEDQGELLDGSGS